MVYCLLFAVLKKFNIHWYHPKKLKIIKVFFCTVIHGWNVV